MISTKQKWQRDDGRIKAHQYIGDIKEVKLIWVELFFNNGKVDSYDNKSEGKNIHLIVYLQAQSDVVVYLLCQFVSD